MSNNKLVKHNGIISKELLQRIDNINDDKEYDPYQALRKTTLANKELFNENDYTIKDEDIILKDEKKLRQERIINSVIGVGFALFMMTLLGGLLYVICIGGIMM